MNNIEQDRKLRLVLVIEEERFHHPGFVDELIRLSPHPVVGAIRVTKAPPQSDVWTYLFHNIHRFKLVELYKYAIKLSVWGIKQFFGGKNSVADVLRTHRIPYFDVKKNINTLAVRKRVAGWSPDLIISSNPLYFGKKLLEIPTYGCLNRHTALLPAYGGILPLFHAIANGEKRVGVTIHKMIDAIDRGPNLAQAIIPIFPGDTLELLFTRGFALTTSLILQAVDTVYKKTDSVLTPTTKPSYYSFPTAQDWKNFRRANGRLV